MNATTNPLPSGPPANDRLHALRWRDPFTWLAAGGRDLAPSWRVSLVFGVCFWLMAVVLGAVFRSLPEYTMSFVSGCFLVGPFLAMGLYESSRRRAMGEPQDLGASLTCWDTHLGSMGMLVLVLVVLELLWGRASLVVFAVFFNTGMPSTTGVVQAIFNPENWEFVAVYSVVGGVFASAGVLHLRGVHPHDPGPRHRRHHRRHHQHPGGAGPPGRDAAVGRADRGACCWPPWLMPWARGSAGIHVKPSRNRLKSLSPLTFSTLSSPTTGPFNRVLRGTKSGPVAGVLKRSSMLATTCSCAVTDDLAVASASSSCCFAPSSSSTLACNCSFEVLSCWTAASCSTRRRPNSSVRLCANPSSSLSGRRPRTSSWSLVQIALGARQIAQQARVVLKGVDGLLLLGGQGLVHGAQLGLQVLHLLLMLALVLIALLLGGLPEMLQRLARMLVLFFQGLAMAFFGREALLQVGHLLRELRAFQGLAAQRFAGFAVSGFFIGQRPLGLLQCWRVACASVFRAAAAC
jgi:hypothetical protein